MSSNSFIHLVLLFFVLVVKVVLKVQRQCKWTKGGDVFDVYLFERVLLAVGPATCFYASENNNKFSEILSYVVMGVRHLYRYPRGGIILTSLQIRTNISTDA